MPSELEKFQADLLQSVTQMRRGKAVCVTMVKLPATAGAGAKVRRANRREVKRYVQSI